MQSYQWIVIGSGCCGIGMVGKLLDMKMKILWIDPTFNVGRIGEYYKNVPANTNNEDFIKAFDLCKSFEFHSNELNRMKENKCIITKLEMNQCYNLEFYSDTLKDITNVLQTKVDSIRGFVTKIHKLQNKLWEITIETSSNKDIIKHCSQAIILCCGSIPIQHIDNCKSFCYYDINKTIVQHNLDLLVNPLYCYDLFNHRNILINHDSILTNITKHDIWAVIGNSHSAMLVIKNLYESGIKHIINIYRSELRFMHVTKDGIKKYQGIGLKGNVGEWVYENCILKNNSYIKFKKLLKHLSILEQLVMYNVQHCVFAIGFEKDSAKLPIITVDKTFVNISNHTNTATTNNHNNNYSIDDNSNCQSNNIYQLTIEDLNQYDRITGEITPSIFTHFKNSDINNNNPILNNQSQILGNSSINSTTTGTSNIITTSNMTASIISTSSSLLLFGSGIAFPQDLIDDEGKREPWIGFKRSIEQTDLMLDIFYKYSNEILN